MLDGAPCNAQLHPKWDKNSNKVAHTHTRKNKYEDMQIEILK